MRKQKNRKRLLSTVLSLALVFSMTGTPVFATGNGAETRLCEHHPEHTAECGYMKAVEGRRCEHKHTADCYTDKLICSYENEDIQTASDSDAEHKHTLECYELNCQHVHDNECGYVEAMAGHACGYICEICGLEQDSGKVNQETVSSNTVKQECICTTVCTEDQVNADCPVCSTEGADLKKCVGKAPQFMDYERVVALFLSLPEADSITPQTTDAEKDAIIAAINEATAAYEKLSLEDTEKFNAEHGDLLMAVQALNAAITGSSVENLAVVEVNYYTTFKTAVTNASSGDTIKLTDEIDLLGNKVSVDGKDITIDLNGHTLQYNGGITTAAITVKEGASLKIMDSSDGKNGKILAPYPGGCGIYNDGGKLEVLSGSITTTSPSGRAIENYGETIISGGTISTTAGNSSAIHNYGSGSITVSGGTVFATDSGGDAIWNRSDNLGKILICGSAVVTSKCTGNLTGTIYFNGSPENARIILEIKDNATVSNTANPEGYSVYFHANSTWVTPQNINGYYSQAASATVGKVFPTAVAGPAITVAKHPQNKNFAYGSGQSTLNAEGTASNGKLVAYQWYQADGTDKSNAVVISGAQNASFHIPTDLDAGTYYYFCRLSAADCANADTDVATVTVAKAAYPETVSKEVGVRVNQPTAPTGALTAADFFVAPPAEAKITAVNSTTGTNVLAANSGALSLVNGSLSWTAKDGLTTKDLTDSYTVTISSKNYNDITASLTFKSVDKIPVTIAGISVTGKDYDGKAATVNGTARVTVTDGGADVTSLVAALDYKWQKKNNNGSYAGLPDAPKDAGSYKLIVSVPDSNQTYEGKTEITFSIAKKALEIKPEDKSITVGDAMPTFNLKYDGLVAGDTLSPDSGTPVFTCNAQDTNTEGAYAITWDNMDSVTFTSDNYDISKKATGTLTISKKTSGGGSSNNHSPSGGNSSDDNSSSGSQISKPAQSMTGSTTTNTTVDGNGNANVTVTTQNVNDAIAAANAEAAKKGVNVRDVNVVIHVVTDKAATQLTTNLLKIVQDSLISNKVGAIEIKSNTVTMRFSQTAIQQINSQAQADVTITAAKADNSTLTGEARTLVGSRPVFNFTATYGDGKAITNFGTNSIYLAIPYTLGQGEKAENVQVYYIDANGALHGQLSTYDTNLKAAVGVTNHFSTYAVGYKPEAQAFNDIANHWAKSDIEFVSARSLLAGTGKTTFSPDSAMTRGMFVTALGRLAGINPDDYKTSSFTDVKASAYYSPYVEWTVQKGIVTGTGNKQFSPDLEVTREQMAVIMVNYAGQMGYSIPTPHKAVTFADNASISEWAAKEVSTMQQAGILMGKDGNRFDPQGKATRAEVSAVLHRFVELIINPTNAQGWTKNDSGHWLYYRDGTKLIGWQTVGGSRYYFNSDGVMHEGWKEDTTANKWYYWDNNGAATGWKQVGGKWYYFNADGSMAVNTTVDGYQIGADGVRKEK